MRALHFVKDRTPNLLRSLGTRPNERFCGEHLDKHPSFVA